MSKQLSSQQYWPVQIDLVLPTKLAKQIGFTLKVNAQTLSSLRFFDSMYFLAGTSLDRYSALDIFLLVKIEVLLDA